MTEQLKNQRWSTRNRVRMLPVAAAAFAAPAVLRHSTRAQQAQIRVSGWTSTGAEFDIFNQIIADAQAALPEIAISYEPVPSDFSTKIQTDIAAGSAADVFYVDSLDAPDFMVNNALLPLDGYMSEAGVTADQFYPGLFQSFQLNGVTYGLPKDWSSLAMVYGKQGLADAGVTTPPTTWDELRAAGQALLDYTGEARICIPADPAREFAFHYQAGAKVISDDGTAIQIDTPEAQIALDFYYGLYRDGIATTPADSGAGWPGDALAKGLADIVFEGNWMFPFLSGPEGAAPDLEVEVAEMPSGPGGKATLAFTVSFSAYAQTQYPEQAWQVLNYLTGAEGMAKWCSLGIAMPSRIALADAWAAQFPERAPFIAGGDYARGWQLGVGGKAFYTDASSELQGLFAGTLDVPTALANMQSEAETRIQLTGAVQAAPSPDASPEASPVASPMATPTS